MKSFTRENRILLALLAAAVLISLAVIAGRWRVEAENKTYDVILDYNELELLAQQSEEDVSWWLEQFRDMGITRVGLTEESLISLMESSPLSVTATMMDTVMQDADWRESYPEAFVAAVTDYGFDRFDVVVETSGQVATDFVTEAVAQRFHPEDVVLVEQEEEAYILLNGVVNDTLYLSDFSYVDTFEKGFAERSEIVASKLMYISLGLMPEKVETIQSMGMEIVPRTICYNGHNDTRYAQAVVAGYERYGIEPTYIIAGGEAVIGLTTRTSLPSPILKTTVSPWASLRPMSSGRTSSSPGWTPSPPPPTTTPCGSSPSGTTSSTATLTTAMREPRRWRTPSSGPSWSGTSG